MFVWGRHGAAGAQNKQCGTYTLELSQRFKCFSRKSCIFCRSLPFETVRIYLSVTLLGVDGYHAENHLDVYIKQANLTGYITGSAIMFG